MARKHELMVSNRWKTRTIVGGALVGAFAGLIAAWLLTRRADKQGRESAVTPMEAVQLGALVFGLLRAIAALGEK